MRSAAAAVLAAAMLPCGGCAAFVHGMSGFAGLLQGGLRRFVLLDGHGYAADGNPNSPAAGSGVDVCGYRGRRYGFDAFSELFGGSDLGRRRAELLAGYRRSPEGRARGGFADDAAFWAALPAPDRAVFLTVVNALHSVRFADGVRGTDLIAGIDSLRGDGGDRPDRADPLTVFRVRGRYTPEGLRRLADDGAVYRLTQAARRAGADRGWGRPHGPHPGFAADRVSDGLPCVQWQVPPAGSDAMEIDLDYELPALENHFSADNSNPLAVAGDVGADGGMTAANHFARYHAAFGDPGFRPDWVPRPGPGPDRIIPDVGACGFRANPQPAGNRDGPTASNGVSREGEPQPLPAPRCDP